MQGEEESTKELEKVGKVVYTEVEVLPSKERISAATTARIALVFMFVLTVAALAAVVTLSLSGIWVEPPVVIPDVFNSVLLIGIGAVAGVLGSDKGS
jgi:hypothetical protein